MTASTRAAIPYVLPMAGFVLLTAVEGALPAGASGPIGYPVVYTLKVVVVAALAWSCRSTWCDLQPIPSTRALLVSVLLGLGVAALWVGLDGWYPELALLGKRTGYNPMLLSPPGRWAFVAVRLMGLALLVPLIEELFWRSFAIRWVIDPDQFSTVPIGRVTPAAALTTGVLFGLQHPEWLPGVLTGLAWAGLVARTRSVSACVVSHAVANLALGLYVLFRGDWKFW